MAIQLFASTWTVRGTDLERPIQIKMCPQKDGSFKFGIFRNGYEMDKNSEWNLPPMNSNKDDDFFENYRFDTLNEACNIINAEI